MARSLMLEIVPFKSTKRKALSALLLLLIYQEIFWFFCVKIIWFSKFSNFLQRNLLILPDFSKILWFSHFSSGNPGLFTILNFICLIVKLIKLKKCLYQYYFSRFCVSIKIWKVRIIHSENYSKQSYFKKLQI